MTPEQRAEALRIASRIDSLGMPHPIDKEAATLLRTLAAQQAPAEPVYLHCGDGRAAFPVRTVESWPEKNRAGYVHKLYTAPPAPQAPAEPVAYREGAPLSAAILERENWLAVADQRLYGIGFTVNGWHVPAPLVAVFGAAAQPALSPAPQARQPLTDQQIRDAAPELLAELDRLRAEVEALRASAPADPMDWPLPCDVQVGHGTMRKGVRLVVLVARMKVLYEMATGQNADEVAGRTPKERQARFEASDLGRFIATSTATAADGDGSDTD